LGNFFLACLFVLSDEAALCFFIPIEKSFIRYKKAMCCMWYGTKSMTGKITEGTARGSGKKTVQAPKYEGREFLPLWSVDYIFFLF
jgi:hypothetical protein